jgi:hypothetical protein
MLIRPLELSVEENEVEVCVVAAALTVRTRLATWVSPPPLPVTINVYEAVCTSVGNVTVSVETKFGVAEGLLNTPLAPEGNPETDNDTCELKPLRASTFTEYDTVCPWSTLWEGGVALIVKSANGCVLVDTACVLVDTDCVVVCTAGPTVKVVLIMLLDLFGSKPAGIVVTTHVNLCVPGVVVQGVCKVTVIGTPAGPG